MSSYMFDSIEQDFLAYIYCLKGLDNSNKSAHQDNENGDDLVLSPIRSLDFETKHATNHDKEKKTINSIFVKLINKGKEVTQRKKQSTTSESDDSYDAFVISAKKENNNVFIIIVAVCIIMTTGFITFKNLKDETPSIIDKSELTSSGYSSSEFRTIIER